MCALSYAPARSVLLFTQAFDRFRSTHDGPGTYAAWAWVIQAIVFESNDFHPLDRWIALFDEVRREHPDFPSNDLEVQTATAMLNALFARRSRARHDSEWPERAETPPRRKSSPSQQYMTLGIVVHTHVLFGDLAAATRALAQCTALAQRNAEPIAYLRKLSESFYALIIGENARGLKLISEALESFFARRV